MRDRLGRQRRHGRGRGPLLAAGALIGSTVLTVAAAGPILALEAGHAAIRPAACQIALPDDH
jgi:hypothetical protein